MKEYTEDQIARLKADGWTFKENADPTKPGVWLHPVRGKKLKDSLGSTAPVHVSALPPIGAEDFAAVRKEGELPPNPTGADIHAAEAEARKDVRRDHEHRIIKD